MKAAVHYALRFLVGAVAVALIAATVLFGAAALGARTARAAPPAQQYNPQLSEERQAFLVALYETMTCTRGAATAALRNGVADVTRIYVFAYGLCPSKAANHLRLRLGWNEADIQQALLAVVVTQVDATIAMGRPLL